MPGRPRAKRAERLAGAMAVDLRKHGPATIGELLDRLACGPRDWQRMSDWEKAASRIAIGQLINVYGARLNVDSTLYLPPRRRRAAMTAGRFDRRNHAM
jgi:hypothetical protein